MYGMLRNVPIDIRVDVTSAYGPVAAAPEIESRCAAYAQDLAFNLGLPIEPRLTITAGLNSSAAVQVAVNGECVNSWTPPEMNADDLVSAICELILRSRSFMIDRQVSRTIWSFWYPRRLRELDDETFAGAFEDLCREIVTRGLSVGHVREHASDLRAGAAQAPMFARAREAALANADSVGIGLLVSTTQYADFVAAADQDTLDAVEQRMFDDLGLSVRVKPLTATDTLQPPWFAVTWNDVVSPPVRGVGRDEFFVAQAASDLARMSIDSSPRLNPADGTPGAIVNEEGRWLCEDLGVHAWDAAAFAMARVTSELRRNAGSFMTMNLLTIYQYNLRRSTSQLVEETNERFDAPLLTTVLRLLLDEEISIRDLQGVLNALLLSEGAEDGWTAVQYADLVRNAMRRYLTYRYTGGAKMLPVYSVESKVADLSGDDRTKFLDSIAANLNSTPRTALRPVLLTSSNARRSLRKLIAHDFPDIAVLSPEDLARDVQVHPLAQIAM